VFYVSYVRFYKLKPVIILVRYFFRFGAKSAVLPVLWIFISIFLAEPTFAQFNGNFDVEKHYLRDENPLDWKAYQYSKIWLYDWYNGQNGFAYTVGSLSQEHFYTESEARLTVEFGDYFTVMYSRNEESLIRPDPIYQEIEFRFGGIFGLSLIGFPAHEKKYDNIGGAISLGNRWTWNYVRLSALNQFFEYNDKNDTDDKNSVTDQYIRTPDMSRLELQTFIGERLFLKGDIRNEHETELLDELTSETKTYSGYDYRGTVDLVFPDSWLFGVTGRRDWEKRDLVPDVTSDTLPDLAQILDYQFGEVYLYIWLSDDDQLSLGYLEQTYSNTIDSSVELQRYEHRTNAKLYWIKWETKTSDTFQWTFEVIAGQVHLYKDNRAEDEIIDEITDQAKFKLGATFLRGDTARLLLTASFDLDYYNRRIWDGGGGQIQVVF